MQWNYQVQARTGLSSPISPSKLLQAIVVLLKDPKQYRFEPQLDNYCDLGALLKQCEAAGLRRAAVFLADEINALYAGEQTDEKLTCIS